MAITVDFVRAKDYPQEHFGNVYSERAGRVIDVLYCSWDDRITLAVDLLGSINGSTVNLPEKYVTGDGFLDLFANTVDIEHVGFDTENLQPKKAKLTVTYTPLEYDVTTYTAGPFYVSESLEPASEFLTLDKESLYWDSGQTEPLKDIEAPAMIIRLVDWVYTIYGHSSVPDWVWTHVGKINDSSVTSSTLEKTFAAKTLLCGNPTLSRSFDMGSNPRWEITTRLTYRPDTWNKFPRSSDTGALSFSTIYDGSGTAKEFYEQVDFDDIVQV